MTWTLNASGHIQSEQNTEDSERALASALQDAIRNLPTEDVSSCTFSGNFVQGDLRTLDLS